MKNKREQKRIDDQYSSMQAQHNQDAMKLSKRGHMNNQTYRKWNSSAYDYNPSKHRYEFNEKFGRSAGVPKNGTILLHFFDTFVGGVKDE